MSYVLEVDMIRLANEKDLLTTPYVFCEDDAAAMAQAGADIVVCHLRLTTGGSIGAETALKLEDCPPKVAAWAAAALPGKPAIRALLHGGALSMPAASAYMRNNTETRPGVYGATAPARVPPAVALPHQ